jgi:hypothetical protein
MSMPADAEIEQAVLTRLVALLADVSDSMSWVISRFKEIEHVDDAHIQRFLRINERDYLQLAICGRPREYLFAEDIETLSERFSIAEEPLARMVRRVEAVSKFREYEDVASTGLLSAARDIAEGPAPPYQAGEVTPEDDEHDGPKKDKQ